MSKNLIGQTLLNQYRVDAFVASGGMGIVYRVWDYKRDVPLAMKVLHDDLADDPSILKRFEREAMALKKLTHPNIVPFYGLFKVPDAVFMLGLYIDGATLSTILKHRVNGRFSIPESLAYLKSLCAALGYAHSHGVVHCDVKPGNVLVDKGGGIFLADFGIARHAESTTTTLATAGTSAYMAPEQILGHPVNAQTDVYALGVVLYEMLTGRRPFSGRDTGSDSSGTTANERIRYAQMHLVPPNPRDLNPEIPEELANVTLKALAKKQEDRFHSMQSLLTAALSAARARPEDITDYAAPPQPASLPFQPIAPPSSESEYVQMNVGAPGYADVPPEKTFSQWLTERKWLPITCGILALVLIIGTLGVAVAIPIWPTPEATGIGPPGAGEGIPTVVSPTEIIPTITYHPSATIPTSTLASAPSLTPTPARVLPPGELWSNLQPDYLPPLRGHTDNVSSVAFSPDGKILASASADHTIRLWDIESVETLRTLTGHRDEVNDIAFSPNGKYLASCSDDSTIRIWSVEEGETLHQLSEHDESVGSVAFSPDGRYLASAGKDGKIYVWIVETGVRDHTKNSRFDQDTSMNYVNIVIFNHDGSLLLSGGANGNIYIWDPLKEGDPLDSIAGHEDAVRDLSISPDGKLLASASSDGSVRIWESPVMGEQSISLKFTIDEGVDKVKSLAFSHDGSLLASVMPGEWVHIRRVDDYTLVNELPFINITSIAFSPDDQLIATGMQNNTVLLWTTELEEIPTATFAPTNTPIANNINPSGVAENGLESKSVTHIAAITPTLIPVLTNSDRPNILIIISDDQRYDTMEYMPLTKSQIFDQGVTFSRGYITTPACCPSRASILTGMFAHKHGVHVNQDVLDKSIFVRDLHNTGYLTGLVGKYLNSWDGSPRPEFDYWVSFDGGGSPYYDPDLNVQGEWDVYPGYITYLFRDFALEFIQMASRQEAPFLLIFTPTAPHEPADPAPGDESLYPNLPLPRPPNFNEQDVLDKPYWLQERHSLSEEESEEADEIRRSQLQCLYSLDKAINELLKTLEENDQLENTFIVYLSDNGYFWGEHRLKRGKAYAYEESILVPFAIRYRSLIPEPRYEENLIANIDLAPTIYDLLNLPIPLELDGYSLLPLLRGSTEWRDSLIIENWTRYGHYKGVRSDRYLYVEWESDLAELYDVEIDPYQLNNLAYITEYEGIVSEFRESLKEIE